MTAKVRAVKLERHLLADAKSGLDSALRPSKRIGVNQTAMNYLEAVEALQVQKPISEIVNILTSLLRVTGDEQAMIHLESDASKLDRVKNASQLFQYRLWSSTPRYSQALLFDLGQDLLNLMAAEPFRWGNWAKWLDAKFEGTEPFGLSRQQGIHLEATIANLPELKWDAGSESINDSFSNAINTLLFESQQAEGKAGSARSLIIRYLENLDGTASNDQISAFLDEQGISIERTSLNWALTNLVSERKIWRVRRGHYSSNQHAREALEPEYPDSFLQKPEPQKPIAVQFDYDDEGKVAVDATAGSDRVRNSEDARDRHSEVVYLAQQLIESFDPTLPGANSATELIRDVKRYLDTLGQSLNDIRPSILVLRGDGLRQLLRLQMTPSEVSDLAPISDKYLLNLQRLVSAHNLLVGVDPHLAARDEALLGPDDRSALISPVDGKRVLRDAVAAHVATADAESILSEEGSNVQLSNANPRLFNRYSEGVRNFARAVIASTAATAKVLWKHKGSIAAGIAALPPGALVLAKWALANEAWFLSVFSQNSHMLSVINGIMEALRSLPLL